MTTATTTTTITDTATVTATAATTATTATTTVLLLLLLLLLLLYYRCCSYLLYNNSYNGHYHFCTRTLFCCGPALHANRRFPWLRSRSRQTAKEDHGVANGESPNCQRLVHPLATSPMAGENYRQRLVEWKAFTANGW